MVRGRPRHLFVSCIEAAPKQPIGIDDHRGLENPMVNVNEVPQRRISRLPSRFRFTLFLLGRLFGDSGLAQEEHGPSLSDACLHFSRLEGDQVFNEQPSTVSVGIYFRRRFSLA